MHKRRFSLRSYVLATVLGVALPLLVGAIVLAVYGARQQRQAVETGIASFTDVLSLTLQNQLGSSVAALKVLARSQNLAGGDLRAFHQEAADAVHTQPWYGISVADPDGRQVVSTLRPPGTALPSVADRDYFRAVLATGTPAVSNLLETRTTAGHQIVVAVPVNREGRLAYVLIAGFRPDVLSGTLLQTTRGGAYPDAIASIVDGNGVVLARSHDAGRLVGKKGSADYLEYIRTSQQGVFRTVTVDGRDVYAGFQRLPDLQWTVGFAVPAALVEGPVRRVILASSLGVALLALAALLIGAHFGREVTASITAAADSGRDVVRGNVPALRDTRVREAARLNEALIEAASLINTERTELRRAEAEAREARAEAESANKAKDVFLAMLAHELRNPLAAVRTAADLLNLPNADAETRRLAQTIIARQTEHLARMTDDLLDVGRAISGKIDLHPRVVDLGQVAHDTVSGMRASLDRHEVSSRIGVAWVRGDPMRLAQVVSNVVGNAVRYTPEGRRIWLDVASEDGRAVLRVRDEGRGMTDELRGRVFELFVQGEAGTSRGGLGVGLTLVKRIVDLHGGSVEAASDGPGRGSEFTVRLPLANPAEAPAELQPGAPAMRPRDVLLVEDNDDARESMCRLLELLGHRVVSASDGVQGLRQALEGRPDIALLDISLPGLNGYEIARRVRAESADCRTFLVALTGYGSDETKEKALDAGFDAHLTKPVDPSTLHELFGAVGD